MVEQYLLCDAEGGDRLQWKDVEQGGWPCWSSGWRPVVLAGVERRAWSVSSRASLLVADEEREELGDRGAMKLPMPSSPTRPSG